MHTTASTEKPSLNAILPLFLVLFIDGMGMGIIFPILNPVYMDPVHGILGAHASIALRDFLYGFTLFVFPICMFFGTPILGDLSDSAGRKKVLLICLLGAAIGYALSALGLAIESVTLLILGRVVAGFTAGSQPVAQAAIIDVAPPDKKAQYLSLLMFPVSLGFVGGPLLSGYLADPTLVSWFTLRTPLYFACIISVLNALYLVVGFKDVRKATGNINIVWHKAISLFIGAFRNQDIRLLSLAFFIFSLGWGIYFQYVSLYLTQRFNYSGQMLGLFMGVLGLGFAFGFIFVIKYMVKWFKLSLGIFLAWVIATIAVLITVLPVVSWPAWLMAFLLGSFVAGSYSGILTLYSNTVSEDRQGWVMGVAMSVIALGFGIMSLVPNWLQQLASWVPLATSSALFAIAAVLILIFYVKHRK